MATPFPFTSGQVLTAAQMNAITELIINDKTDSYVLAAGDAGEYVVMNKATATTLTVPNSVFTAGQIVRIINKGAGVCTITAGAGTTVSSTGTLALAQNAAGTLIALSASAFIYEAGGVTSTASVVQVKSTALTSTFTSSSTSFTDITGLSVSITPTSASNKVLVMLSLSGSNNVATAALNFRIDRGGTAIAIGDAAGSRDRVTGNINLASSAAMTTNSLTFLDSPATTSATTYKVQGRNTGAGTFFINRPETDTDAATTPRGLSTITVMEVAP